MSERGRPQLTFTATQRRQVEEARACGETIEAIADGLDISLATLRKYFAHELAIGRAKRRLEIIGALFSQMRKGNVAATKHLEQMTADAAVLESVKAPKPLGKKDAANADAQTAHEGTSWGELLDIKGIDEAN